MCFLNRLLDAAIPACIIDPGYAICQRLFKMLADMEGKPIFKIAMGKTDMKHVPLYGQIQGGVPFVQFFRTKRLLQNLVDMLFIHKYYF